MIYFLTLQIKQIAPFWILGLMAGAVLSTYSKALMSYIPYEAFEKKSFLMKYLLAAIIGAASPISIYGMLPILAALSQLKVRQSVISSIIITSVLINPNVFIFSLSLGVKIAFLRLLLSILAGVIAGFLVQVLFKDENIYDMHGFAVEKAEEKLGLKSFAAVIKNFKRAVLRTAPNLALGILLAALFELYFPKEVFANIFGSNNGMGILLAASLGVTAYYCGGGTIPLILAWMNEGMSVGAAITFMLVGPATKLTNLTGVKTIMSVKSFSFYLAFNISFGVIAGLVLDLISNFI